jgi:S1-C subfamily serine protease
VSFDDDADDDADDSASLFGPPPHPDDRLWRHPSEVAGRAGRPPAAAFTGGPATVRRPPDHRPWGLVAAVVGAAGAVVAGLAIGVAGIGDSQGPIDRARGSITLPTVGEADGASLAYARDRAAPSLVRLVPAPVVPARPPSTAGTGDVSRPSAAEAGGSAGEEVTGVVLRAEGIVVTSADLVGPAAVTAQLADGRQVAARLVGADPVTGLAVLDLDGDGYQPATPGGVSPGPGTHVVTVAAGPGHPEAGAGVVLGTRRVETAGPTVLDGVLAVRSTEHAYALGAATVDGDGDLLGVTTAMEGDSTFTVPLDVVAKVTDDLLADGAAHHSWLGIDGLDSSDGATAGYGLLGDDRGVVVSTVRPDGPSAAAGLHQADVIMEIDGHPVRTMPELVRWLRARSPGDDVELTIERDGATTSVVVTVGQLPSG